MDSDCPLAGHWDRHQPVLSSHKDPQDWRLRLEVKTAPERLTDHTLPSQVSLAFLEAPHEASMLGHLFKCVCGAQLPTESNSQENNSSGPEGRLSG